MGEGIGQKTKDSSSIIINVVSTPENLKQVQLILRLIEQKFAEKNRFYVIFVNLEKVFNEGLL